jgi:hypothetical protein
VARVVLLEIWAIFGLGELYCENEPRPRSAPYLIAAFGPPRQILEQVAFWFGPHTFVAVWTIKRGTKLVSLHSTAAQAGHRDSSNLSSLARQALIHSSTFAQQPLNPPNSNIATRIH